MGAGAAWIMLCFTLGEELTVRHKDTNQGVKLKILLSLSLLT